MISLRHFEKVEYCWQSVDDKLNEAKYWREQMKKKYKNIHKAKPICFLLVAMLMISLIMGCGMATTRSRENSQGINASQSDSKDSLNEADSSNTESQSEHIEESQSTTDKSENEDDASVPKDESGTKNEAPGASESGILQVHYIDVGQGDATLLVCDDEALLIDAGNNSKGTLVQNYIRKQGISELKYIIGTHPDADHIGGLDVIITKYNITSNQVWMPDIDNDTATYRDVVDAIKYKNLKRVCPQAGKQYSLGKAVITILAPVYSMEDSNDNSICILVQNGKNKFIFTGDASEEEEAAIVNNFNVTSDVLKVGHHGSKGSTSDLFLSSVSPDYAVLSVGKNSYGHPTAQCLNRLRMAGIKLFRTDEQGSIIAVSDGENIAWNCSPTESWKSGEKTKEIHNNDSIGNGDEGQNQGDNNVALFNLGYLKEKSVFLN